MESFSVADRAASECFFPFSFRGPRKPTTEDAVQTLSDDTVVPTILCRFTIKTTYIPLVSS